MIILVCKIEIKERKMKRIVYFILAVITIGYVGFLCYFNIALTASAVMTYIAVYGGLAIALAYAAINFFGNPLKIVFFILLIVAVIVLILTIAIPGIFRNMFGIVETEPESFLNIFR